jgi:hypothetical protein
VPADVVAGAPALVVATTPSNVVGVEGADVVGTISGNSDVVVGMVSAGAGNVVVTAARDADVVNVVGGEGSLSVVGATVGAGSQTSTCSYSCMLSKRSLQYRGSAVHPASTKSPAWGPVAVQSGLPRSCHRLLVACVTANVVDVRRSRVPSSYVRYDSTLHESHEGAPATVDKRTACTS